MNIETQLKILIVDDVPANATLLAELLRNEYIILMASNGHDAVKIAALKKPDLILLDIIMPEIDGYEVCKKLKSQPSTKDILIIFVTAKDGMQNIANGLELGAVDYITKPFRKSIIKARIRSHLSLQWHRNVLAKTKDKLELKITKRTAELECLLAEKSDLMAKAQAANIAKTSFLATMTHEIRTPMNAVLGNTELMLATKLTEKQRNYAQMMYRAGENLLSTLDDILDFSKIEAGKLNLARRVFSPPTVLADIVQELQYHIERKGLSLELTDELPKKVKGDPARLRQVIITLLSNAIKFTENGGIAIAAVVSKNLGEGIQLDFKIRDTGIGINQEEQMRIFSDFSKTDDFTSRAYRDAELGLVIAKQLIELMGGTISVQSEIGKGSTFHFTVQVEKCSQDCTDNIVINEDADKPGAVSPDLSNFSILVAEDDVVNQSIVSEMLKSIGCRVDIVSDGQDVIDAYSAYDLVLMDLEMPTVDGYAAALEIRKLEGSKSHIPIIALSAHAFEGVNASCFAAGMDDYLAKPVTIMGLKGKCEKWLG